MMARDYKKESAWLKTPEQAQRNRERKKARYWAEKAGKVTEGDGKEVHHVGAPRKGSLAKTPTRVVSRKANRSMQPKRKST